MEHLGDDNAFCFVAYDMLWTQYKVGILATATKDKDMFGKKLVTQIHSRILGISPIWTITDRWKLEGIPKLKEFCLSPWWATSHWWWMVVACTGTKGPGIDQDEGCWFDSVTRMPWDVPGTSGRCWSCWSIKNLCTSQWETRLAYNSIGHLYNLYPFLRFKIWQKTQSVHLE